MTVIVGGSFSQPSNRYSATPWTRPSSSRWTAAYSPEPRPSFRLASRSSQRGTLNEVRWTEPGVAGSTRPYSSSTRPGISRGSSTVTRPPAGAPVNGGAPETSIRTACHRVAAPKPKRP